MKSRINKGNAKRGMLDILQVVWVIFCKDGQHFRWHWGVWIMDGRKTWDSSFPQCLPRHNKWTEARRCLQTESIHYWTPKRKTWDSSFLQCLPRHNINHSLLQANHETKSRMVVGTRMMRGSSSQRHNQKHCRHILLSYFRVLILNIQWKKVRLTIFCRRRTQYSTNYKQITAV